MSKRKIRGVLGFIFHYLIYFSISAYVALTFVVYLVYLWLKINHDLAYVQDVDVIRLNGFLNRIEGVFKYLASIGLGFVAGVCKIFLKEKIGR